MLGWSSLPTSLPGPVPVSEDLVISINVIRDVLDVSLEVSTLYDVGDM